MDKARKIDCRKCNFFYVTWDKKFPYGCRAMGFKTQFMPSTEVKQASGIECLRFEPKRHDGHNPSRHSQGTSSVIPRSQPYKK